jgi:hypothetical protein
MNKEIKYIVLERAEGLNSECRKPKVAKSWEDADFILTLWALSAPAKKDGGGYDKCDFVVFWRDGKVYQGRYDLVHFSDETPDLKKHIIDFAKFYSGKYCPDNLTQEQYEEATSDENIAKDCLNLLKNYLNDDENIKEIDIFVKKLEHLTDINAHTVAVIEIAKFLKNERNIKIAKSLLEIHTAIGFIPPDILKYRDDFLEDMLNDIREKMGEEVCEKIRGSL